VLLSVLDRKWREHLYEMDYLQEGIGLRAMGQRDPLVEYQREGFDMFQAMMDAIKEESVGFLFNVEVEVEEAPPAPSMEDLVATGPGEVAGEVVSEPLLPDEHFSAPYGEPAPAEPAAPATTPEAEWLAKSPFAPGPPADRAPATAPIQEAPVQEAPVQEAPVREPGVDEAAPRADEPVAPVETPAVTPEAAAVVDAPAPPVVPSGPVPSAPVSPEPVATPAAEAPPTTAPAAPAAEAPAVPAEPAAAAEPARAAVLPENFGRPDRPTQLQYSAPNAEGGVTTSGTIDPLTGQVSSGAPSRNAPCPCGSGKKYKRCHGDPSNRGA
jgi:preprotein translocase subunit SecA